MVTNLCISEHCRAACSRKRDESMKDILNSGSFVSLITIENISIKLLTNLSFHLTKNFILFKMQKL